MVTLEELIKKHKPCWACSRSCDSMCRNECEETGKRFFTLVEYADPYKEHAAQYEGTGFTPEHVAELAEAYRDGRLPVLPCKIGETVWLVQSTRGCKNCVNLHSSCDGINCPAPRFYEHKFSYSDMDRLEDIHLTRDGAVAATALQKGSVQ